MSGLGLPLGDDRPLGLTPDEGRAVRNALDLILWTDDPTDAEVLTTDGLASVARRASTGDAEVDAELRALADRAENG